MLIESFLTLMKTELESAEREAIDLLSQGEVRRALQKVLLAQKIQQQITETRIRAIHEAIRETRPSICDNTTMFDRAASAIFGRSETQVNAKMDGDIHKIEVV